MRMLRRYSFPKLTCATFLTYSECHSDPFMQCVVANVDADAKVNAALAQKYEISSFPTLKFFSKDNKEPEDYDGDRSEEAFVSFLNEKCGTKRAVGGGLNDEVSLSRSSGRTRGPNSIVLRLAVSLNLTHLLLSSLLPSRTRRA